MNEYRETLDQVRQRLKGEDVKYVQIEVSDLDGGLRGKLLPIDKGLGADASFSTVLYGLTTADDVYESPFTSYENGFLDFHARPQPETVRHLSWRPNTAAVICDFYDTNGELNQESPRAVLKKVAARAGALGFEPRIGVEYEAFIFHQDDDAMAAGKPHTLKPVSRQLNAYSLLRLTELRHLFEAFMQRMADIGEPVASTHTELGYGAVELAMMHTTPIEAADRAMRAKTYLKELCAEHGYVATFMAKLDPAQPGCGGHIHHSLWRNGDNAFWAGDKISDVARHFVAGQLAALNDMWVLYMPTVNSYRRIGYQLWTPENASWGYDNRTAAMRLVTYPGPAAVRFENRAPGADANPYLVIAGLLAGGLHGIEQGLEPPPMCEGNAAMDERFVAVPRDLAKATEAFANSAVARDWLGDRFVDHYTRSRQFEWQLWSEWQQGQISEWEMRRYFETI
ncbi:MAG: glutamine synthetase family protein [Gammaproteobacteria bacterium]|nr:glutamine synthetase family protein [Gammaproteobacteria bacterium]